MLQERKQKILASRKVKDSTFIKNNNNWNKYKNEKN
jgi:hypothetical protein